MSTLHMAWYVSVLPACHGSLFCTQPTHGTELTGRDAEPAFSVPIDKLNAAIVCPKSQVMPNTGM